MKHSTIVKKIDNNDKKGWCKTMLNELREFQEYVMPMDVFTNPATRRLKYVTFIKRPLSGLERALTIIARWYIYKDGKTKNDFNETVVKELLNAWCGFEHEEDIPETSLVNGWLNRYIRQVFLKEAIRDYNAKLESLATDVTGKYELTDILQNISPDGDVTTLTESRKNLEDTMKDLSATEIVKLFTNEQSKIVHTIKTLETLEAKVNSFNSSIFSTHYLTKNDFKAIKYERIIANAFHLGKLKQFYLLCDSDPFENELVTKHTNTRSTTDMSDSDKDLLLRITALYLLQKQNTDQNEVYFNQTDLANWLYEKADPKNFELKKYRLTTSGEPLFNTISVTNNVTKLKIHKNWIEHFKIVESCDIDKPENRGLIFYSDPGCSEYLRYNEKYQEF